METTGLWLTLMEITFCVRADELFDCERRVYSLEIIQVELISGHYLSQDTTREPCTAYLEKKTLK